MKTCYIWYSSFSFSKDFSFCSCKAFINLNEEFLMLLYRHANYVYMIQNFKLFSLSVVRMALLLSTNIQSVRLFPFCPFSLIRAVTVTLPD